MFGLFALCKPVFRHLLASYKTSYKNRLWNRHYNMWKLIYYPTFWTRPRLYPWSIFMDPFVHSDHRSGCWSPLHFDDQSTWEYSTSEPRQHICGRLLPSCICHRYHLPYSVSLDNLTTLGQSWERASAPTATHSRLWYWKPSCCSTTFSQRRFSNAGCIYIPGGAYD